MKNRILKFKITSIFLLLFLFSSQKYYAQCTNPIPTGNATPTYCKIDNNTVGDLVVTGTLIAWFDSSTGGNQISNSELLIHGNVYYADDVTGGGCSPNRLAVTVGIYGDTPTNVDVFVGKCATENATIADLSATGSNIQWFDAQTNGNLLSGTDLLVDGQTYWVQQTENGCTSNRLPTTVTIIDPPAPVVQSTQQFCSDMNPTVNDLSATGTSILWYDAETSTIPLDGNTPLIDGEDYWAVENSFPCESSTRIQTIVQIDIAPDAGLNGSLTECEINLTTTNLFSLLGGTPDITGTWTGPSTLTGGHLGTFDPLTNIEGTYTYTVSSILGVCTDQSSTVSVTIVIQDPPTVSNSNQSFCSIDMPTIADLTATGTNLLWYDSETSTTPLNPTDFLIDGEDYWATQTDTSSGCESNSRVVVNVIIINPAPPTITNSTQTFCEIENPTIADLSVTGTTIQWYDSETATTPLNSSDLLIDGEDYWATQTDASGGCESETRAIVNVIIETTLPPTTSSSNQTFCELDRATIADLNASGENIIWYDSETSTTPLNPTDLLIDGEDYWATQTLNSNNCESELRLIVQVTIISTQPPTTINSNQSFCLNDFLPGAPTIADLSATGTNIQWYESETATTPLNSTDLLVDGEDYWASQSDLSSSCESLNRLVINVTFINPTTPTTSNAIQLFCIANTPTIADLDASGSNIIWYDSETATTPLNSSDLLINGEDYWAEANNDSSSCTSISRLQITVTILDELPVTITNSNQSFCASDLPTVMNLDATGNNILWFDNETIATPLDANTLLVNGEDYWAVQTNSNGCISSTRLVVNVSLTDPGTPTIVSLGNEFCLLENPTINDLNQNVSSTNGGTIEWFDGYPNGSILSLSEFLVEGETYFAVETNTTGCSSTSPLAVTVTLEACDEYDIETYDGFSPSGDNVNETFKILNLRELYPNFKVEFFNRWGDKVYTSHAGNSDWNGRLNGDGKLVSAGVYYYIIYFNKNNRKPIQKSLYLSR